MSLERRQRKMIFKNYDKIISTSKKSIKFFGVTRIPIITLNAILDKAKISLDSKDYTVFEKRHNDIIETLKNLCLKVSKTVGDNAISINELSLLIDALKKGYLIGEEQRRNKMRNI